MMMIKSIKKYNHDADDLVPLAKETKKQKNKNPKPRCNRK